MHFASNLIQNAAGTEDRFTVDTQTGATFIKTSLVTGTGSGSPSVNVFKGRLTVDGTVTNDMFQVNATDGNYAFHINCNDKTLSSQGLAHFYQGVDIATGFQCSSVSNFDNTTQQDISGSFTMDGAVRLDAVEW